MLHLLLLVLALTAAKGAADEMACDAIAPQQASYNRRTTLRRDLLCEYDREVLPKVAINVSVDIHVRTARVVQRTLQMRVLLNLQWKDPRLAWDPAHYDNIAELQLRQEDIWVPHISTISTLPWIREDGGAVEEGAPDRLVPAVCDAAPDGTVTCSSAAEMGGICVVDTLYWPHYEAACNAFLGPDFRLYKNIGVKFSNESVQTEMQYYMPTGDWVVVEAERNYYAFGNETNVISFRFKLHSRNVVISAILTGPAVVLSLFLLGSFCFPVASHARIGLCCTSIFGTVLASAWLFESLGPYDGPSPIIVRFYTGLLVLSAIAVLMSFLLTIVTPHSSKPPAAPRWLYSFQTWLFNSKAGKLLLRAMLMAPPGQRGEYPGPDQKEQENEELPAEVDGASLNQTGAAHQSSGPHKIWEFTATFVNRAMFYIFLLTFSVLGLHLISCTMYQVETDMLYE